MHTSQLKDIAHLIAEILFPFCIYFRTGTPWDNDGDDDDDAYFSSYAHFGIHEEMLKVYSNKKYALLL